MKLYSVHILRRSGSQVNPDPLHLLLQSGQRLIRPHEVAGVLSSDEGRTGDGPFPQSTYFVIYTWNCRMLVAMTSRAPVGVRNPARPMNSANGKPRFAGASRIVPSTRPRGHPDNNSTNSACDLGQRLFVNSDVQASLTPSQTPFGSPTTYLLLTLLAAGFLATTADGAFASDSTSSLNSADLYTLAENEDFWANVLRYISYFFSVLLGTAYVAFKPVVALLKRPTTAILVIVAFAGLYYFVSTTVKAMIGVDEFTYEPSSLVTPYVQ